MSMQGGAKKKKSDECDAPLFGLQLKQTVWYGMQRQLRDTCRLGNPNWGVRPKHDIKNGECFPFSFFFHSSLPHHDDARGAIRPSLSRRSGGFSLVTRRIQGDKHRDAK